MALYELSTDVTFRQPVRWQAHLRYSLRTPGREVTLPAGVWLLELPAQDQRDERLYRLADGQVVARLQPLTEQQATVITNPQTITAIQSYRTLEEAAAEDWGLQVEHIDRHPPFKVIKCPLCSGTGFTSVDFAQVWCDTCNANFTVRHTSGDPGFVVDCTWQHYSGHNAHYLLPRTAELCLTLVLKDSGDLLELTHNEHCWRDDCMPEQVASTGPDSALRPGLHACQVGTLYGWSLGGRVPVHYDHNRHGYQTLYWPDGRKDSWPETAFVRTSNLTHEEGRDLEQVRWELERQLGDDSSGYKRGLMTSVRNLLERPASPPYVAYRVPFPDASLLNDGEKYLLHRWLLKREKRYHVVFAYPVWLVVTAADGDRNGWRVVQDNLCPRCGHSVRPEHLAGDGDDRSHRRCRELWDATGWPTSPHLFARGAARAQPPIREV